MIRLKVIQLVLCLVYLILHVAAPPRSAAAVKSSAVVIDSAVTADFTPEEAFMLLDIEGQEITRVRALLIPPFPESEGGKDKGKWTVGARVNVPDDVGLVEYTIVLKGKDLQFAVIPGLVWRSTDAAIHDSQSISEYLDQRRELLDSWKVQVKAQDENLRRLRLDADTIANVARIVDVIEQLETAKYDKENLEKNLDNLRELLKQVKDQKPPKNYARRELELTKQITELANSVKDAESRETGRRSESQSDLQKKLAIVEATRLEDPQKLLEELTKIREKRISLEQSGLKVAPTEETNYWDVQ